MCFKLRTRPVVLWTTRSTVLPTSPTGRDYYQSYWQSRSTRNDEGPIDGAGWHRSDALKAPDNIYLLKLPPYAPELNPIEHVWDELREKFFHNRVFKSLDALEDHLAGALKTLEGDATTVGSIVSWPWIIAALLTSVMN